MMAQPFKTESIWDMRHNLLIEDYKQSQSKMGVIRGKIKDLGVAVKTNTCPRDFGEKQIEEYEFALFSEEANYLKVKLILEWVEVKMGYPKGNTLEDCEDII